MKKSGTVSVKSALPAVGVPLCVPHAPVLMSMIISSSPGNGLRARTWDACLYGGFTREASGHNPRASQALRLKRRHEHKLLDFNQY